MIPAELLIGSAVVLMVTMAMTGEAADPVDLANSIRARGCGEYSAVERPLRNESQLAKAARLVAGGDGLERASAETGYRAKKLASIHIRTSDGDLAQVLASRFCDIVADDSLQEAGAFRRGDAVWIVLAAPFSPPPEENARTARRRVLELVNEARSQARQCGRKDLPAAPPLKRADALEQAAGAHARDMATHSLLGHRGSDGSMPADRATRAGYDWATVSENVAGGQTTAKEVVTTWISSPGHCESLMNPRYSESGVARATNLDSEHVVYWVQVFAAPE